MLRYAGDAAQASRRLIGGYLCRFLLSVCLGSVFTGFEENALLFFCFLSVFPIVYPYDHRSSFFIGFVGVGAYPRSGSLSGGALIWGQGR
jgi:hypothetical protein